MLFDAAPESMLLFALMERGEVAMIPADHHPASNNIALIGRSSRPVGVAYDPIEQVRTPVKRILELNIRIEMTTMSFKFQRCGDSAGEPAANGTTHETTHTLT